MIQEAIQKLKPNEAWKVINDIHKVRRRTTNMTDEQQQPKLDSWDDFTGEFIKCDIIKKWPFTLVPVNVDAVYEEHKGRIFITFSYNERDWKMELNKTNQAVIRAADISPKDIVGKKLTFEKTKARNPKTNQQVDSFLLVKVE